MKNQCLLGAIVALAMALGGAPAQAQLFGPYPPGAFYLGPEGGWTHLTSQNPSVTIEGPKGYIAGNQVNRQINYNAGFNAGVRAGYAWGPWRVEGEYSYRNNNVSNSGGVVGPNGRTGFVESGGDAHSNAIMANVIYDFTLGWPITPHIGGGIGAINVNRSIGGSGTATAPNGTTIAFTSPSFSGSTWGFGYQAIAGIRYMINPALAFDVDYRYLASTQDTLSGAKVVRTGACCFIGSVGNVKYGTQNVVAS
jgi:opacity protein-like surface antigen